VLFVRRGTRPGLFAPRDNVTQFNWSMAGGISGMQRRWTSVPDRSPAPSTGE
jgi:hypothetical protein